MAGFSESYLGRLRQVVGDRLILMPGGRVVVEDGVGRVLLQHRSDFDLWGVPGGAPEEGEDLTASILRELKEETGLDAAEAIPFGFASDPAFETITYPNGHRCQYFILLFAVRTFQGEATVADDESHAVEWFTPDALPQMLPNMRRTVEAYMRFKESGEFQVI
ncbi:NUDIX domain-containing protein [Phenylobacterium sp.]|jgi:8-oxo-dGTP pyrophosphatase MutT (NUDIX family)|uniref:NUDIX domain-containing protein n=1 Tax=Phenylobacterium sp. TaxID=1871053 RepID=UPI002E325789|nr:NUDIX domain-containing protein [Phenylobacterium sp.]HEX2559063.1 NUDIX domain-containing protein [Phenylobacterium sp.]